MKNSSVFFINIGIFIMTCLVVFTHCPGKEKEQAFSIEPVTIHDTIFREAPPIIKNIPYPVPAQIDTQAILRSYFSKNISLDTLVNTGDLLVAVRDTVTHNQLCGRQIYYSLTQPVIREKLHGLGLSSVFAFKSIPVTLNYEYDSWRFSAGYDIVNKAPVFGVGYRFKRW